MELQLERRDQENKTVFAEIGMICPSVNKDYWSYRVRLSDTQAVVGFPKYHTVGIGLAVEDDWNTNLPFTCEAEEIFRHIKHNKADSAISDDDVREAIRLIQAAVVADRAAVTR